MKAILQFQIDDETEKEKFRCAQKGYAMSGFIDSFLDYLMIIGPHLKPEEAYDEIYNMYVNKLYEYDVVDMLEEDTREMI